MASLAFSGYFHSLLFLYMFSKKCFKGLDIKLHQFVMSPTVNSLWPNDFMERPEEINFSENDLETELRDDGLKTILINSTLKKNEQSKYWYFVYCQS